MLKDHVKPALRKEEMDSLTSKLKIEMDFFIRHYRSVHHSMQKFKEKHSSWISKSLDLSEFRKVENLGGRPRIPFEDASERTQRRQYKPVSQELSRLETPVIAKAAATALKKKGSRDLAEILDEATKSPNRAAKMRRKLDKDEPVPMTSAEALALMLDTGLSVSSYKILRQSALDHNCNIYPRYENILQFKRETCRPVEKPVVTQTCA